MTTAWLVAGDGPGVGALVDLARSLADEVAAVVVGDGADARAVARVVDRVDWVPCAADVPAESFAAAVAEHLAGAELVLAGTGPASRVLAGAVAARAGAPVLTAVREVVRADGAWQITRLVVGGIATERNRVPGPVVLATEGGRRVGGEEADSSAGEPAVQRLDLDRLPMSCPQAPVVDGEPHDLASAARVVGVGRGVRDPGELDVIAELARALGAEVACSRPVAEDLGWFPKDRYLGVSGRRISPRLYLALGISGQLQHMIGVRDATMIVAVNTDRRAPVMAEADVAVVADVHVLLPALLDELGRVGSVRLAEVAR
ncbi:MAG: FAD-binding protein [Cellulomonas sp.]|nr:FAD-binding protein [Cellulomonas sp.]